MIADEIKKAGQATIDQCVENLVTYKLTDTWNTFSGLERELGALACNTGGSYQFDGDFGEYLITFAQDVCRYNGTPVKTIRYENTGEDSTYEVKDFSNNQIYSDEGWPAFTVRQIEFQNNKQSFQLLSSGMPSYTDTYYGDTTHSETGLLNTTTVRVKKSCTSHYTRYLTSVNSRETKKLTSIVSGSSYVMVMINIVQSDNYDWTAGTHPDATCDLNVVIKKVNTSTVLTDRPVRFNFDNPGNMMVILQPGQVAEVTVWASQATKILCTIQETSI